MCIRDSSKAGIASRSPARGTWAAGANTGSAWGSFPHRAAARSPSRSAAGGSTGRSTTVACGWSCSCFMGSAVVGAASARRTVVTDTPTASATACNVAPPLRRPRMSATMSSLNREGPLGPRLRQARPAAPEASSSLHQRHNVTVETANAAATSSNDAALIRTSWTAASRRPASSPASHTKDSSPRMNTRPPSSSCTNAATAPNGTPPLGVRGRGGWAVMTPIISTPQTSCLPYKNYSSRRIENLTVATVFMQVSRLSATTKPSLCQEPWLSLIHVAVDPRRTDDHAVLVADRCDGDRDRDHRSVLSNTHRLEPLCLLYTS